MKLAKVPAGTICKITQFLPMATNSGRETPLLFLIILEASIREQLQKQTLVSYLVMSRVCSWPQPCPSCVAVGWDF